MDYDEVTSLAQSTGSLFAWFISFPCTIFYKCFARNGFHSNRIWIVFGLGVKLILAMITKLYLDGVIDFSECFTRIACRDDRLLFEYFARVQYVLCAPCHFIAW